MKNLKVSFVRPPNLQKSGQWKKQGVIRCPLNLGLLASYVRIHSNAECCIVDFEIEEAVSASQMAQRILADTPDVVCFTTLTPRYPVVVHTAQALKALDSSVVTVVGGPHFSGCAEESFFDGIDYGIIGEGELALAQLLNGLAAKTDLSRIANLGLRTPAGIQINPARDFISDLDSLPDPAWDLMKIDEYRDPSYFDGPHLALFTSRGCPYDCSFCASCVTWKRQLRLRSAGMVLNEISYMATTLGVHNFMFWDDTFAAQRPRALAICNGIIERDLDVKYTVQVRADAMNDELAQALKRSGCAFAAIGVESGNEAMLQRIGKRETKAQLREAVAIMRNAGLPSIGSYIIGLPDDTRETIAETIDFAFELDCDQSKFMILAPYPGTRDFELARQRGLVGKLTFEQMEALNFYDTVSINLSQVSDNDLIRYQDEAYARFDQLIAKKQSDLNVHI